MKAESEAQERQESSVVASELANNIERRMYKGPFSAVLVSCMLQNPEHEATLRPHLPACGYGLSANEEERKKYRSSNKWKQWYLLLKTQIHYPAQKTNCDLALQRDRYQYVQCPLCDL